MYIYIYTYVSKYAHSLATTNVSNSPLAIWQDPTIPRFSWSIWPQPYPQKKHWTCSSPSPNTQHLDLAWTGTLKTDPYLGRWTPIHQLLFVVKTRGFHRFRRRTLERNLATATNVTFSKVNSCRDGCMPRNSPWKVIQNHCFPGSNGFGLRQFWAISFSTEYHNHQPTRFLKQKWCADFGTGRNTGWELGCQQVLYLFHV